MAQKDINPYKNSDSNKRYYTYEYYMRRKYGQKCAKIPLDGGLTCPNIDGRCGVGGCIYCSGRGSGDFAELPSLSIEEQYKRTREKLSSKWDTTKTIAYFQAHTNTYAPLEKLKTLYESALLQDGVVGLNIATRADCLSDDVAQYLASLADSGTNICVELGLQSSSDKTAQLINRGHTFESFTHGYNKLRNASPNIAICVHLIFGLPSETYEDMMKTVRDTAALSPNQVKIHLLHVIKGTVLAQMYERGEYLPLEREEYIKTVCDALEILPPETVIARLTGDGMAKDLLAPLWSIKKTTIINDIDKKLFKRQSYQGVKYVESQNITVV